LIIIVAGSILSAEFSAGTVKFLLINPVKRWKIFAAKYITVLTFSLAMLITLYVFNVIFAGVFLGFGDLFAPHLSVADGGVVTGSSLLFLASRYLLGVVEVIILGTFAFAVSSLVRSSALAIGLGVFLYFSGWMAVNILAQMNFYQAKYILFANTNLLNISHGMSGFVNHTLTFAVVNIAVYMFVFLLTAYDGFVRGDVK
jgi:ABC-2 type transport system permease protein